MERKLTLGCRVFFPNKRLKYRTHPMDKKRYATARICWNIALQRCDHLGQEAARNDDSVVVCVFPGYNSISRRQSVRNYIAGRECTSQLTSICNGSVNIFTTKRGPHSPQNRLIPRIQFWDITEQMRDGNKSGDGGCSGDCTAQFSLQLTNESYSTECCCCFAG
jgi:hypothetical protein